MTKKLEDLNYQAILTYTPYDNKFDESDEIPLIDFYREIFILISEFIDEFQTLKKAIDPDSIQFKPIYIISGYSGNGKTTFINWFKLFIEKKDSALIEDFLGCMSFYAAQADNKHERIRIENLLERCKKLLDFDDNYCFDIVNLVEKPHNFIPSKRLIKEAIKETLEDYIKEGSKAIKYICNPEYEDIFYKYFSVDITLNGNTVSLWDEINIINDLSVNGKPVHREITKFVNNLPHYETLLLFLLEKTLRSITTNCKSYVICFDNLDEIHFEYLTNDIWVDFLQIRNNLSDIFRKLNLRPKFDFAKKVVILLVFREANLAVLNAQHQDRISRIIEKRRLILTSSGREIVKKRLNIAEKSPKNTHEMIHNLVKIMSDSDNQKNYTDNVFLPLFNYDYRKMIDSLLELSKIEYIDDKEKSILDILYDDYQEIYNGSRNGARGILFHAFIKYLIKKGSLLEFATGSEKSRDNDRPYCRASRVILTTISNLSYPDGFPSNREKLRDKMPIAFSLKKLIDTIILDEELYGRKPLYKPEILFDWLKNFFIVDKSSWAHLISVYGKTVNPITNELDFTKEKEIIVNYLALREKKKDLDDDSLLNGLNKIQIQLNGSGYVYLRHLIVHFEYFSNLESEGHNPKNYKPLFLSTEIKNGKYEFESLINSVIKLIINYKKSMDAFLKNKQINPEKFGKSLLTFRSSTEEQKDHYSTRILKNNIRYLDNFRKYLLLNNKFREANNSYVKENPKIKSMAEINTFLLDEIEVLINLFESSLETKDPSMSSDYLNIYKNNLKKNRNMSLPNKKDDFISIPPDTGGSTSDNIHITD